MNDFAHVRWADDGSAHAVADHVERAVADKPAPIVAVPGGSTPIAIFDELARRGLDWAGVTLMLTDDRQVPLDHPASNQAKLEGAFCATAANIIPLEAGMDVPPLDLCWLGMGADGHIASLFPKMQAQSADRAAVIRTTPEPLPSEAPFPRLSMNMAALAAARDIILVARGTDKKAVLDNALAGRNDLPVARLLQQTRSPLTIYWSEA